MFRFNKFFLVFLISTFLISCASVRNPGVLQGQQGYENQRSRDISGLRSSFVKVRTSLYSMNSAECRDQPPENCTSRTRLAQGHMSGALVRSPAGNLGVVTAAHGIALSLPEFLDLPSEILRSLRIVKIVELHFSNGQVAHATQDSRCDIRNDVCFLIPSTIPDDIRYLQVANQPPSWGDVVRYAGNPLGVANSLNGILPIFWGHYSGDVVPGVREVVASVYTVFAAPGSSGSPIVNESGNMVGVVQAVITRLPLITISISHQSLLDFLHETDESYRQTSKP